MKIQDFFEKGFYLNLDNRSDRKEMFEEHIKEQSLDNFFERFSSIYYLDPGCNFKNPHFACFATYQKIIEKCYHEGYSNVLILEDDVLFLENSIDNIEAALDDLKDIQDWDLLYLGCMILDKHLNKVTDHLLKQKVLLTSHAIGYSRRGIEKIFKEICNKNINGIIDTYFGEDNTKLNKYIVYPLSVVQHNKTLSNLSGIDKPGDELHSYGAPITDYERGFNHKFYTEDKRSIHTVHKNFVTCGLQGRTGNMMFQIAHAYVKSLEHNRQFVAPRGESSSWHLEKNLFRKIDFFIDRTDTLQEPIEIYTGDFEYHNSPAPNYHTPTVYYGWYQSEKFFHRYKNHIKALFSPTQAFIEKAYRYYPFLENVRVAAINVRRGDYLEQPTRHPVVSLEYINEAYKHLPKHDKLLIVSDDIEWCRENLKFDNMIFNDNKNFWDAEALWLLSLCDHFIISNSTFSWWGAWLSNSPFKVVIAPDTWFGPDIKEETEDIYCEDWIKIPTYYENGKIFPK